jgi:3-oxoacyl-[acyl-carrier protein] reductase
MDGTVVITGAGTPLADRVAGAFAETGAHVAIGGPDQAAVDAVTESIETDGGTATPSRVDVRDEFDLERFVETASRVGGGIDVVVPTVSVAHDEPGNSPLPSTSYSAYDDTMRANARGVFATIREAVPHLDGAGRVVIPVVQSTERAGAGAFALSQAVRLAVMRGFAADLDQAVAAVDIDIVPGSAAEAAVDEAVDRIVWAGTAATAIDGALLDGTGRDE